MTNHFRPRIYGDCQTQRLGTPENVCPWSACQHHVESDSVDVANAGIGATGLTAASFTCSLAFVDANPDGADLETIGASLGISRERVRQIEERALRRAGIRNRRTEIGDVVARGSASGLALLVQMTRREPIKAVDLPSAACAPAVDPMRDEDFSEGRSAARDDAMRTALYGGCVDAP